MVFIQTRVVFVILVIWKVVAFQEASKAQDFSGFENTEPGVEYDLGTLSVDYDDYYLRIINLPDVRFSNGVFYTLLFWKEGHEIGKINFIRRNEELQFQGILIHEQWRKQHLSKPFLKAFCQLALITCHKVKTFSIQRKPMVNLQLQKIGLKAECRRHECYIDVAEYGDGKIHVYTRTSTFPPMLVDSQKLHILNQAPEKYVSVPVFTHFSQPVDIDDFEEKLLLVPGNLKFNKLIGGSR